VDSVKVGIGLSSAKSNRLLRMHADQ